MKAGTWDAFTSQITSLQRINQLTFLLVENNPKTKNETISDHISVGI